MSRKFRYCDQHWRKCFNAPMSGRGATRTEQVYAQLRRDILSGRAASRAPTALRRAHRALRLQHERDPRGPQRLVEQGLVRERTAARLPRRVRCRSKTSTTSRSARCEIEGLVLRMPIEHGDIAWESEIVAAHLRARSHADGHHATRCLREEWVAAHRRFHEALIAACPNQRLRAIASTLRDAAELYRHWSRQAERRQRRVRDIGGEHRLPRRRRARAATHTKRCDYSSSTCAAPQRC